MTDNSCICPSCVRACYKKPGWFAPGEAEKLAEAMGLTLKELFEKHLAVDWWEEGSEFDHNVFVLAPRLAGEDAGTEYPGDPQGRCALLTSGDDRCSIHTLGKPHECRVYHHAMPRQEGKDLHLATAKLWDNPEAQKQIVELLGREPEASYYEPASIYERFGMFR